MDSKERMNHRLQEVSGFKMGNVLYELHFKFDFFLMIPVILLAGIVWLLIRSLKKHPGTEHVHEHLKPVRLFYIAAGIFTLFFGAIVLDFQYDMYKQVTGAYRSGDYEIVEGYVDHFTPLPPGGHSMESFDINGVYFQYSDNNIITGYNTARCNGGVITGDGQYLKIGYIHYNDSYGNIIVYIEECQPG